MPQRRYQVNTRPLQEMCQLKTACGPGPRRRHGTSPPLPTLLPSAPLSFHLVLSQGDSNDDLIPYFHMCPARLRASSQTICFQNSLLVPKGPEILFLACPRRAPEILPTKNTKKERRQARGAFSRAASTWGVGRARQVCPWGNLRNDTNCAFIRQVLQTLRACTPSVKNYSGTGLSQTNKILLRDWSIPMGKAYCWPGHIRISVTVYQSYKLCS